MTEGKYDFRLQDLSRQARDALDMALSGRPLTLDALRSLDQRAVRNMPRFGRKTSDEIAAWARRHGIEMPDSSR